MVDEPAAPGSQDRYLNGLRAGCHSDRYRTKAECCVGTYAVRISCRHQREIKPVLSWSYESVRNILSNRIYTGDTVPFKSHVVRVGSNHVKQVPEEMRQIIPDTHEAIVSRERYYRALTVIKSVKRVEGRRSDNPFTSLLYVAAAGTD